jgi:REP-associated tyrosine transposase
MSEPLRSRVQIFDPEQDYSIVERRLPHWSQAGTIAFMTWRTWDSIPEPILEKWLAERDAWLKRHGISVDSSLRERHPSRGARGLHWQAILETLEPSLLKEFQLHLSDRWNDHIDACHGACVLRRPAISQIVANSLLHFDGDRYELTDYVVMPNHVHVLVAFSDDDSMLRQCESWKHFTAAQINRALGRSGHFWQQDGFDHLVRSLEQFEYLRQYIADNPRRANLSSSEFRHLSKPI